VKRGQQLVYYIQTEGGNMIRHRGEQVVFLENPAYEKKSRIWSYQTIENSDREPRPGVISIMRRIKSSRNRRTSSPR
jgi:hypothetical protein